MRLEYVTLDVFTSTPLQGNPLAIVRVPSDYSGNLDGGKTRLSQQQKQLIAREFNLSETVFLHEQTQADAADRIVCIDIFTSFAEVPFAGHPTVGTTNYLLRILEGRDFETLRVKAGDIAVRLDEDGSGVRLDVAHNVHIHHQPFKGESYEHFPVVSIVRGMTFILAKVKDLEDLGSRKQSFLTDTYHAFEALDEGWQIGLVASYFYADFGLDERGVRQLRTRMFGSREDPATGSAASALCSYLSLTEQNGQRLRKYELTQGVEIGRKSDIKVAVTTREDGQGIAQVVLSGRAVKVMEGTLEVREDL